jgi:hypothetical protein
LAQRAIGCNQLGDARSDIVRRGNRSLDVQDQHRIIILVGQQSLKRRGIAIGVGIADDVDRIRRRPDRRKHGIELRLHDRADGRRRPAKLEKPVDCETADAISVGEDR